MIVFTLPGVSSAPNLQKLRRDPLLTGDNGGVLYISDIAFPWSYTPGPAVNGKVIRDLAEKGDGSYLLASGQTVAQAGGGLDYSAITTNGCYEQVPASVLASLFAQQYFLVCGYFKFPAKADWKTGGGMNAWIQSSPSGDGFQATPDLVTIGPADGYSMRFYRQRTATEQDAVFPTVDDAMFGTVCQVAFWRNAAGQGARIKNAAATVLRTLAVNANNTQNFSSQTLKVGAAPGFGPSLCRAAISTRANSGTIGPSWRTSPCPAAIRSRCLMRTWRACLGALRFPDVRIAFLD